MSRARAALADALGLSFVSLVLLDYLRPALLLLPTIAAGGDTPCHYPTAVFFSEHLLPHLRFHGWYPGAYVGQPLLLYYFPLPFLIMSAFAPLTGMPVAFKLGTALGIFLLPLLTYAAFRLMGFRFPAPLLGAGAALLFLFLEENPIWGGTIASTLAGEFAYMYGLGLAVFFLGVVYHCYARGRSPWLPALALGLTGLAHGYAVLWAGLSASFFLYGARRPLRTLGWLLVLAALSFALVGFWVLPLLSDWGWTTPYDDPWITISPRNLFPVLLLPLFACAGVGLAATFVAARATGGPDRRLLFLLHAGLVGAALAAAGPALGIIDVRFAPFAQLALCLAGAATLGLAIQGMAAADLAALGVVIALALHGDARSQVIRSWIDWNYTGLEAKELWPAWHELTQRIAGSVADPRVAVEYSPEHEKAGSIRMYETLPYFSGRSTLEGVYNQASLQTHPVYYLASELNAQSPNPFKSRDYSTFDTDNALKHLQLFNVSHVVALSSQLVSALEARSDVARVARIPPYTVFALEGARNAYVEPLAFAPVRSSLRGWRDKAYRWFSRKPASPVHLVFTEDARFDVVEPDEWLKPPAVPLAGGVEVSAQLEAEAITIHTSRPGHPLLVKVSYHPRWRAEGADGPYLVSPALMLVVPRQPTVRLSYGRRVSDYVGTALTIGTLLVGLAFALARGRLRQPLRAPVLSPAALDACQAPKPPRRWGGLIPATLVVALSLARVVGAERKPQPSRLLYEKASKAYSEERYEDAAEYARNALAGSIPDLLPELRTLRGESLLRSGRPREAAEEFETVTREHAKSPYMAQALFGTVRAREATAEPMAADAARQRLLRDFAQTPWADRARQGTAAP